MGMDRKSVAIPEVILGEKCLLRTYRPGDGKAMFEAIDESREHLWPEMIWITHHVSPEDSESRCMVFGENFQDRIDLSYGIWSLDGQTYLGGIGLHRMNWEIGIFEIGYWIRQSAEGKGYVTEATKLLTNMAFDTLNAARVFIMAATENTRSRAVPVRLGMPLEGILRNNLVNGDGKRLDAAIYAVTERLS
jgi:RimJ/RimL family protein N-acetyltransferase